MTKTIKKADGSSRYTYDVRPSLKCIHEKICQIFFRQVTYPDYLQGSIKNRDYLSNVKKHVNSKIVISEDITNFFPSITKKVVHEMWIGVFGFSNEVAACLAELVTMDDIVPQGAKTSSHVCNLILWNREYTLVNNLKRKGLTYTRYVDDITVSSKKILCTKEKTAIINSIYSMLRTVGAKPNRKKHKVMPRSKKQDVHRVNINHHRPSLPKYKRNQIRLAVYGCEKRHAVDPSAKEYLDLYRSVLGRVNTMARMHKKEAEKLRKRLELVKPLYLT